MFYITAFFSRLANPLPIWIVLCWTLTIFSPQLAAENDPLAKTKAAYLFKFTKFVDWPALVNDTLHICIIGSEQIVELLSELASRDNKGHILQIWSSTEELQICQILYIARTEPNLPNLLQHSTANSVLTVSDAENFAQHGGSIGFYNEQGQIKLEINMDTVRSAQLKINALLMEVARIITAEKK